MARLETELLSTIGYITQDTRGKSCVDLRVYKWKISVVERSEGGVEEWLYHELDCCHCGPLHCTDALSASPRSAEAE